MVWIQIVIALVMAVVGELLRPKPKFNDPQPSALGDFSFPTVDPSRVIPVFWGTCKFEGPNCTWFGDLEVVTLKKKVKTGWFSSKKITTGFNYYLGVQLVYAYGEIDEFIELRADDKTLDVSNKSFTGDVCSFQIDSPMILSSDDPPSGVKGFCQLYKGTFTQPTNVYLSEQWGEPDMSAFRPLCHLVMEKCYLGNTETPPPISLVARRCPNQLGLTGGRHNVNGDANIACAAFELMTNTLYGMKISALKLDRDSFIECGNTLADEGLGISMLIQTAMPGAQLLAEILRHADGVIYADPITGLYTMALARDDYLDHLDDLLVFDDSNITADSFEFTRVSWEMTKNTIVVNYTERATFQTEPVQYQDLANIDVRQGVIDSEEINFLGYSNAQAALNAAARACKTRSSPLVRAQFNTNRLGYQLRPGSVFKMSKQDRGIEQLIMRVIEINYGTLDDMAVKIIAMEDVFAVGFIAYAPPTPSDWQPVIGPLEAITRQSAFELPYEFSGSDGVYVGTLASSAARADIGYEIWSGTSSGDTNLTRAGFTRDFTASGLLTAPYPAATLPRDPDGFQIDSTRHINEVESVNEVELLQGDSVALIISTAGREMVAFKNRTTVSSGVYGITDVIRGVYGTVALSHPAGSLVWFLSTGFEVENENPRNAGSTVYLKYLTRQPFRMLTLGAATQISLPLVGVAAKPYPARYLRINGTVDPANVSGDASLSWEFVNPVVRGGRISVAGSGSDPVTPGVSFTVRVYVNGVLVRTSAGNTSPSFAYTVAMRLADSSNTAHAVKFGVTVVGESQSSVEAQTANTVMTSAATPVTVSTAALPNASTGVGYSAPLAASGGAGAPYTWSVSSGALPVGISIDNANQRLTGSTNAAPGVFNVTLRAESPAGVGGAKAFTLTVT